MLSVFGGKITTYRRLAEAAMARLAGFFPAMPEAWTAAAPLPGGDFAWDGAAEQVRDLAGHYPFLSPATIHRLVRSYGTEATSVLGTASYEADLGQDFSAGLYAQEVDWLMRQEWARTAEDILWRRTKLGLCFSDAEVERLRAHMRCFRENITKP